MFLEMEVVEDRVLAAGVRVADLYNDRHLSLPTAVTRISGDKGFRLVLSHKSEVKEETAKLKERLGRFGVSAFVGP